MSPHVPRTPRTLARVALAAGLLAGGAAVLAPAPSYAGSVTVADPVGDPVRIDDQDDDGEYETTPVPGARAVDIGSTAFVYRSRVLVVRATTRLATDAVTPRVRVRGGGQDLEFTTDDAGRVSSTTRGGAQRCRGASATHDGATDVYRVEVPARCFGAPDRVRVGLRLDRVGDTTPSSVTLDDAVKGGHGRLYYRIGLGPVVRRG